MHSTLIEAIIFDMDGVIFDTEPIYFQAQTTLCKKYGKNFTEAVAETMRGRIGVEAIEIMRTTLGLTKSAAALLEERDCLYVTLLQHSLQLVKGFIPAARAIKKSGKRTAVATAANRQHTDFLIQQHHLGEFFDVVITGDDVSKSKPDPEIYNNALSALGMPASRCLAIEDSLNGVIAAKRAGLKVIALNSHSHRARRVADLALSDFTAPEFGVFLGLHVDD